MNNRPPDPDFWEKISPFKYNEKRQAAYDAQQMYNHLHQLPTPIHNENPYGGNPYGGNPYGGNPYGGFPTTSNSSFTLFGSNSSNSNFSSGLNLNSNPFSNPFNSFK